MNTPARRLSPLLLPALLVAGLVLLLGPSTPSAQAATCKLSSKEQYPKTKKGTPTYNLRLTVSRTSCKNGKRVAKAYHSCRSKRSVVCKKKLVGRKWKCTGRRTAKISSQFTGTVTCKYGKRRVVSSFQQNT